MCAKLIPGTVIPYSDGAGALDAFRPMIRAAGGLTLGQICTMTALEPWTVQNWIKRGFVPHPTGKKYGERHLSRILLICALRDAMKIESVGELMHAINGDTDDESDDIISEQELYLGFCELVRRIDGVGVSAEEVKKAASALEATAGNERLADALTGMVLAYFSGILKKEADGILGKIKNN